MNQTPITEEWEEVATSWATLGHPDRARNAWLEAGHEHQRQGTLRDAARCFESAGYLALAQAVRYQAEHLCP